MRGRIRLSPLTVFYRREDHGCHQSHPAPEGRTSDATAPECERREETLIRIKVTPKNAHYALPVSFSCPHFDVTNDFCLRLSTDCVPGRRGCVLGPAAVFAVPVEERIRLKEEEKRAALLQSLDKPKRNRPGQ